MTVDSGLFVRFRLFKSQLQKNKAMPMKRPVVRSPIILIVAGSDSLDGDLDPDAARIAFEFRFRIQSQMK